MNDQIQRAAIAVNVKQLTELNYKSDTAQCIVKIMTIDELHLKFIK